jgi:signal peptidase I
VSPRFFRIAALVLPLIAVAAPAAAQGLLPRAFIVPTGAMAEAVFGDHLMVPCPACSVNFPVNASLQGEKKDTLVGCVCPNCRLEIKLDRSAKAPGKVVGGKGLVPPPTLTRGDRVTVGGSLFSSAKAKPARLGPWAFYYPAMADKKVVYLFRVVGLPRETVAAHRGRLYVLPPGKGLTYGDANEAKGDPKKLAELWKPKFMHADDPKAKKLFEAGKFQIVRRPPDHVRAQMRLVYAADHPAADLTGPKWARWTAEGAGWEEKAGTFRFAGGKGTSWLRYRHLLRSHGGKPSLITDFLGYNSGAYTKLPAPAVGENWASDLIVECEVEAMSDEGELTLELSKGPDQFQAEFDLADGSCSLYRLSAERKAVRLARAPSGVKGKGKYALRFANVDDRLVVWVGEKLPFGEGVAYAPARKLQPTKANDLLRPARVGAKGQLTVSRLRLFRDTYHTACGLGTPFFPDVGSFDPADEKTWPGLVESPVATWYVQPDHYFVLGDNSPMASDSRSWGTVPSRFFLGRLNFTYYPLGRSGWLR